MGSTSLKIAKVASVASLALLMSTGVVSAAQASPAQVASDTCGAAGGGTWCRGSGLAGVLKSCHSNYVHPNNFHSSTASIGANVDKRYASAGSWSTAYATNGVTFTCFAYYDPTA